ncbi:four helix bundle protein [Ancylomarina salipaludis]|uniref:Four helix bundle protein n=1 Tax=Ancylomarina salipaludis TaxID=2501299 RepID=A0A4V1N066_9BACT|nr:four helix bundle protein [Ancylomarina salipaludis]RXQ95085.1 four helix bundle protein [Ancylomarina salipaludis]
MENKFLELDKIYAYKRAFTLSNYIWNIIISWDFFSKDTVGKQFTRSIDSISANLAEGYGRYHKKDKIKFYRYAMGSLRESIDWNEKSRIRKLINEEQYFHINNELRELPQEINYLIKFTNEKLTI